ncbi:DUF4142 domain-containing protein [Chitinophaga horti]|uniref:DUF4142 domain-containing protein n=1 Tax=Chitinophaga horti TaxID=2920382 RepID=A0ABY6J017_9BACT|nr:DUF4142 domain-containing protein [Chitinophaga horti]UYQ91987.1 DUF4142 domain-containing protein [Chitinophaga horti]
MKRRHAFLMACLVALPMVFAACSDDDDATPETLAARDRAFMVEASYGNWNEVDMGRLADSVSTNDSVNAFAQGMIRDHSTAQSDLVNVGNRWSLTLPNTPDSLHIAMKQAMRTLTGTTFDTAYLSGQIVDHMKAVALYQMAVDSSVSPSVKAYAAKYLPGIKMHLQHVQRLRTQFP